MIKNSQCWRGVLWLLVGVILVCFPREVKAEMIVVTNATELKTALEKKTSNDVVKVSAYSPLIDIGSQKITISTNKTLDLNGSILKATTGANYYYSGGIELSNSPNLTNFSIKNGQIVGGSNDGLGSLINKAGFIYADPLAYNLTVTVQDITHNREGSNGAAFFKGRGSDIVFKGNVSLYNSAFNVRALNMLMYANPYNTNDPENVNFYGYVDKLGWTDFHAIGDGGVNLTFDGYSENSAQRRGKITKNLDVPKNAQVKLVNKNNFPGYLNYANNVGNFAQMNIDGDFIAESEGTSLRTTAAFDAGNVGTKSDQSEININDSARFKISTLNKNNTFGVIYTYNLDINVVNPEIFDIRNFGTGVFFHGWNHRNNSNLNIYNTDIAVWPKESKGIGNPSFLWQNVLYLQLQKFNYENTAAQLRAKLRSSNPEIDANFDINSYSRISNDVALPVVVSSVDEIGNNETYLSGTTNYILPNGSLTNRPVSNAKVTLSVDNQSLSTRTDIDGNWSFSNLDLSNVSGGSKINLTIIDNDQRNSKKATLVTVIDKLPPKATSKLVKTLINSYDFIKQPKLAVSNLDDETTSVENLIVSYQDDQQTLQSKADTLGVKELPISVKDKANNELLLISSLLVTDKIKSSGLVIGESMTLDYDTWLDLDDSSRRNLIIEKGHIKAWKINGDSVTEVTENLAEFEVSYTKKDWRPNDIVTVDLRLGDYTKQIEVTLKAKESKLTSYFLDENNQAIQKTTTRNLISGESYELPIPVISGFKVNKVMTGKHEIPISENQTIKIKAGSENQEITYYYASNQFELDLRVNQLKSTQNDDLTYHLLIKSNLTDTTDNYNNLLIQIPINENLDDVSEVTVQNELKEMIGNAQIDKKQIQVTLNQSVKASENIYLSFKANVKSEAKTGDSINVTATMTASYLVNNKEYQASRRSNTVSTKIEGSLNLISVPKTIDFGTITYQAKELTVASPVIDKHLIVQDTRETLSAEWTLNASLVNSLTNNGEELTGEMIYETDKKELVLSRQSQAVYHHKNNNQRKIDVSQSWSQDSNGLKLKFKATDTIKKGSYSGKIRWTLVAGPP